MMGPSLRTFQKQERDNRADERPINLPRHIAVNTAVNKANDARKGRVWKLGKCEEES